MTRKNAAAVALGRKGGIKGGPARAAVLTPEQRSQSARNAVTARWAKTKGTTVARRNVMDSTRKSVEQKVLATHSIDTSDKALLNLLKRLKATVDPAEIRELSDQIERVVFHKQFRNA
jgi:hypothetical protein